MTASISFAERSRTAVRSIDAALLASGVVGGAEAALLVAEGRHAAIYGIVPLGVWIAIGFLVGIVAIVGAPRRGRGEGAALMLGAAGLAVGASLVARFQNPVLAAAAFSLFVVAAFVGCRWLAHAIDAVVAQSSARRNVAEAVSALILVAAVALFARPRGVAWFGVVGIGLWAVLFAWRLRAPMPPARATDSINRWFLAHLPYAAVLLILVATFTLLKSSGRRVEVSAVVRDLAVTSLLSSPSRVKTVPKPAATAPKLARARGTLGRAPAEARKPQSAASVATRAETPSLRGTIEAPPDVAPKTNFVLITIDTLRADHVSSYGYARQTTPRLDKFAATATLFERAFSPATLTRDAIPALLTGRFPSAVKRGLGQWPVFLAENVTIADELLAAGYRNYGYLTHQYFDASNGFGRGFEVWDTELAQKGDRIVSKGTEAEALTDRVIRALDGLKIRAPFFLWVHYMEPHHNYVKHADFHSFGDERIDRYDGEILFADHHMGRLLAAIEKHPDAARTAIFVTSDHGEGFGEHGYNWHGMSLFNDQVHVPLVARLPNTKPGRVQTPVSTLDVTATIRALAYLESRSGEAGAAPEPIGAPPAAVSLVPLARGDVATRPPVFIEMIEDEKRKPMQAIVHERWKYIRYAATGAEQLFDLDADRGEKRNLARKEPERVAIFRKLWAAWRASIPARPDEKTSKR
ncbi:MAG: sulfatase-like hydrolase/transferase [Deltaproteobacteria bacterium]|nr:sulfatase-like hydrolase/transferase [Deltaproteobacteria bacterium]